MERQEIEQVAAAPEREEIEGEGEIEEGENGVVLAEAGQGFV
jgi:hypothetical protein